MTKLSQQLKHGAGQARDSFAEGARAGAHASGAMTRVGRTVDEGMSVDPMGKSIRPEWCSETGQSSISLASEPVVGAGPGSKPGRSVERISGRRQTPALLQVRALRRVELGALRAWLSGEVPLRPAEAQDLLNRAIQKRQLVSEPALHWRAVKARIAGDHNWIPMGLQLILD